MGDVIIGDVIIGGPKTESITIRFITQGSTKYLVLTLRIEGLPDITTRASPLSRAALKDFVDKKSYPLVDGGNFGDGIFYNENRIVLGGFVTIPLNEELTRLVETKLQKALDDWKEELVY